MYEIYRHTTDSINPLNPKNLNEKIKLINNIMDNKDNFHNHKITQSLDKGVNYLYNHQLPNGEFMSYLSGDFAMVNWIFPDSILYVTAIITHCLKYINSEKSDAIQQKSLLHLGGEVNKGGLWHYYTKYHKFRVRLPSDIDDTCCISVLYKDKGIDFPNPSNSNTIKQHRNKEGLFYTWFIFRFKFIRNRVFRDIGRSRLLGTFQNLLFWKLGVVSINDVDMGVNANVLYYLGEIKETLPVIDKINSIIIEGKEAECDIWYRNPLIIYYFFSRNYFKGITKLEPIVQPILNRLLDIRKPDGSFGESALETAWAICTFINLGYNGKEVHDAINYLLDSQLEEGYWPRWAAYWNGPKMTLCWGSEELTTGFCLEALSRYKDLNSNPLGVTI